MAGCVPSFLAAAGHREAPVGEAKEQAAPPTEIKRPGDGNESYELPPLSILKENTAPS